MLLPSLQLSSHGRSVPHLDTAENYIYVRETKPNRSIEIDRFNRVVNNSLGSPYCAAFAGYCIKYGGAIYPTHLSGLARNYYAKSKYRFSIGDVLKGRDTVRAGDLVIWQRGNTIYGHVGFAYFDWRGTEGWTIEGNTSIKGSKEGIWIQYRRIEPYSFYRIIGFARVLYE